MMICNKANVTFIPNKIDTLKGDNKQTRYLSINPTGHIPMLEEGMFKVLGGNHVIYIYLAKSKSKISELLMPAEMEQKVKAIIGWHQAKMATPAQQIFRILYDPSAFPTKPTSAQLDKWKQEMMMCMKALDEKVVSQTYMCGNKMTIGDIIVYNELS